MAVQITSTSDSYGGIDFDITPGTTFAQLTHLSTDFSVVSGACGGGSPRFQINLTEPNTNVEQIVYAYIGESPTYSCKTDGFQQSRNVLENGKFLDATQAGSLFYTPYEEALAYYKNYQVTGLELVVDSGWMFEQQSITIDNVQINDEVFTFPTEPTN